MVDTIGLGRLPLNPVPEVSTLGEKTLTVVEKVPRETLAHIPKLLSFLSTLPLP